MDASSATGTVDDDDDGGGGGAVEAAALEPLIGDAMILIVNGSCCGSLCLDASPVTKAKRCFEFGGGFLLGPSVARIAGGL